MAHNKFITKNGQTLLDLTNDTVTADKLPIGITAHNRSGELIEGTMDTEAATEAAAEAAVNAYEAELSEIVGGDEDDDVKESLTALRTTASSRINQPLADLTESVNVLMDGYGEEYDGVVTVVEGDPENGAPINAYAAELGTLVGGASTPDGVRTDIENLTDTSNAKTGKSDANLTDAVKTLLEGYGQGGGTGGGGIIEVDTLPEVGEEGKIYGVKTFTDVFVVSSVANGLIKSQYDGAGFKVWFEKVEAPIPYPPTPSGYDAYIYYVINGESTDIMQIEGASGAATMLEQAFGVPFKGEITDTAQATEQGYYAYMKLTLYQYTNGEFKELVPESELPTEVATADEMTALLSTAEIGSIYKYTGETTDTYENGALYVVEESE